MSMRCSRHCNGNVWSTFLVHQMCAQSVCTTQVGQLQLGDFENHGSMHWGTNYLVKTHLSLLHNNSTTESLSSASAAVYK